MTNETNKQDYKEISKERVQEALTKVTELFQTGNVPNAITLACFPRTGKPCNDWSLGNRIILLLSGTEDARGFNQWKRVGRWVKKGAKSIRILAPIIINIKVEKTDPETGEQEIKVVPLVKGFKDVPVFPISATEGKPVEYKELKLPELPLLDRAKELGINVKPVEGNKAFYGAYWNGSIELASPEEKVFFHELSHGAHEQVLGKKLKGGQHPGQEIVAELSAAVLAQLVGKKLESTLGNSYAYISRYAAEWKKSPGEACLFVLSEVQKVLDLILGTEVKKEEIAE